MDVSTHGMGADMDMKLRWIHDVEHSSYRHSRARQCQCNQIVANVCLSEIMPGKNVTLYTSKQMQICGLYNSIYIRHITGFKGGQITPQRDI